MIILFPSYLARSSNISLAVVLALYPLTEAATAVPLGILCDRQGRRRVFLGGLALMGGLIASIALTQNVLVVAALHALMGLAAAAIAVSSLTMITDLTNAGNRGKGMGAFDFSNIGGYAGGLLVGGLLSEAFKANLSTAFFVTASLMIVALGVSYFLLREPGHAPDEGGGSVSLNPFAGMDQRTKAILPIWLSLTSLIGIVFFLPRALRQVGIHETVTGVLLFAGIMTIGLGSIGFGALSDRLGREKTMAIGAAGLFGLLVGLALLFQDIGSGLNVIRFLPILGPAGIATSALVPSVLAAVGDRAKEGKKGATMGLYSLMLSLGIAFGELLAGFASLLGGLSTILYAGSVIFLGASLLTFYQLRRVKRNEATRP
jgi:MFS family permease